MPFPENKEAEKFRTDNKKSEDEDLLPGLDEEPKGGGEALEEIGDIEDTGAEETTSILGDEIAETELTTKLESLIKDAGFAGSELRKKIDSILEDLAPMEEKEVDVLGPDTIEEIV